MNVINCLNCGKIFNYNGFGSKLCPVCRKLDEEDFKKVKEYLYENPGASMTEVANALEIPVSKIKRYLREGRLEIVSEQNLFLQCERCGIAINTGRFCDQCLKAMTKEFKSVLHEENKGPERPVVKDVKISDKNKMRYLTRDTLKRQM